MPDEELLYDLADLFKVFADTTRIKILFALMARAMSVGELLPRPSAPRNRRSPISYANSSAKPTW